MLKIIDSILWAIATVFIVYSGIYYTFKLKFVQFRIKEMFINLFSHNKTGISPFASLMLVLGGRIGVGSIAGIALSIHLGGIGSIFWLWIIGIISAPSAFAETVLGVKYQNKEEFEITGGPSYYLKKGLKKIFLSRIYSYIIVFSYIGGFLSIQANTITTSITTYFNISPIIIGVLIGVLSLFIILGGIKKISNVSKYLVPFMTLFYVFASLIIIISNIKLIPNIFKNIFIQAFNFKSLGFGIFESMLIGIQRGIFSNEAGIGTGAIASSSVKTDFPAKQGFVQMLGIYITTFLICTSTAIVILTSNVNNINISNGIELTQQAFINHMGVFGNSVVIISIILFAFSTILSGYYDGEASIKFLFPKVKNLSILKLITFAVIILGSIIEANTLWNIVNILTAFLAIINIYGIIKLRSKVIYEFKRYNEFSKRKR